jgi:hypothetical protein
VAFTTGVSATAEAAAQRTQQIQQQQQQQQQQREAADKQAAAAAAAAAAQQEAAADAAAGKGSKQEANKLATLWSKAPAKKVKLTEACPNALIAYAVHTLLERRLAVCYKRQLQAIQPASHFL